MLKISQIKNQTFSSKFVLQLLFFCFTGSFSFTQNQITIGTGTTTAGAPVSRFFKFHASEMIYTQSEINTSGDITSIGFFKASGTDANIIQNVSIYMKHTTENVFTSGTTSTSGYTLVYSGNFTNTAGTGWMSVNLDQAFNYNNSDNLQILIIKGSQNALTSAQFPRYQNTSTDPNYRIRSYNDDSNPWSTTRTMVVSYSRPNIRMNFSTCIATSNSISQTDCQAITVNGQTYGNSGIFTQTLVNSAGCDSVLTINFTRLQPTSATLVETTCSSFSLNGQTYTESGTYTQTIQNTAGCDSTITLNLTISNPTSSTVTETACETFTLNGQTYTESGTYTQTIQNVAGCDSTITLNLTISNPTSGTVTETACETFTLNGQTYTESGTYSQTIQNAAGCDSTITLNLTITTLNNAVTISGSTLTATQGNATYQWIDCATNATISGATAQSFSPSTNGNYSVEITNANCTATSDCYTIATIGIAAIAELGIEIYPNPFQNELIVRGLENKTTRFYIQDMQGKTVFGNSTNNAIETIDLSTLKNGMYWFVLIQDSFVVQEKISKI